MVRDPSSMKNSIPWGVALIRVYCFIYILWIIIYLIKYLWYVPSSRYIVRYLLVHLPVTIYVSFWSGGFTCHCWKSTYALAASLGLKITIFFVLKPNIEIVHVTRWFTFVHCSFVRSRAIGFPHRNQVYLYLHRCHPFVHVFSSKILPRQHHRPIGNT